MSAWPRAHQETLDRILTGPKMHPESETEIDIKFLNFDIWNPEYSGQKTLNKTEFNRPCILDFEWREPNLGRVARSVYIHPINFNDPEHIIPFTERMRNSNSLAGIVVTGIDFPETLDTFVALLGEGGKAILETYSDGKKNLKMVSDYRKDPSLNVRLTSLDSYMRQQEAHVTQKKLWVVEKRLTSPVPVNTPTSLRLKRAYAKGPDFDSDRLQIRVKYRASVLPALDDEIALIQGRQQGNSENYNDQGFVSRTLSDYRISESKGKIYDRNPRTAIEQELTVDRVGIRILFRSPDLVEFLDLLHP